MPLWALLLLLQSSCGACAELARKIASQSPDALDSNAVASKLALYLAPTLRRAYARKGFDTSSSHALPLPIEIVQEDPCNNVQTHNLGTVGGRNVAPLKIASSGWEELFFDGRHRPPHPPLKF